MPGQVTTIGRAPTNRIVVRDDICSRNHCEVFQSEGRWAVRDLNSRNGTLVDGEPIRGDYELEDGQLIQIGNCAIGFTHDLSRSFGDPEDTEGQRESDTATDHKQTPGGGPEIIHRARASRYSPSGEQGVAPADRFGRELTRLYRFGLEMGSAQDAATLCRIGVEGLRSETGADIGAILLLPESHIRSPDPGLLQLVAYDSAGDLPYEQVSGFLSQLVFERREAVLARDIREDSELAGSDSLSNFAVESVICAPIRVEDSVYGLVHLYSLTTEERFQPDDLDFTLAVADQLALALKNLTERESLAVAAARYRDENQTLRRQLELDTQLVGASPPVRALRETILRIAPTDATCLIRGESGVGKELVARAIHQNSDRRRGPFVTMNCAALSESLLESELFGHEKGSFTGAVSRKTGKFEQADKGTLFLDEVGEMSLAIQAKFLRVLEGHQFERVGGGTPVQVDVRVVAATNRDLEEAVGQGEFRKDLYFRLHVVEIMVQPLRQRKTDIPLLAKHFLERSAKKANRPVRGFTRPAMELLLNYPWPGNVRELQNAVERAVILSRGEEVTPEDIQLSGLALPSEVSASAAAGRTSSGEPLGYRAVSLKDLEREHILATLDWTEWNKSEAARILGIERSTLDRKLARYEVQRPRHGP
jgi:Nif-specific regulatory protein